MCIFKNKWRKFTPTQKYLDTIKNITSINKLHLFIQSFTRKEDITDYWQTPEQTLNRKSYDCEDMAIFCQDVLKRIQGREALFIIYNGTKKIECHAVCVFPYGGKLAFFSNKRLYYGYDSYIDIGHKYYSKLKQFIVYNHEGKVIKKKFKLIGTF